MDYKDFYLKFIKSNSNMIRFINKLDINDELRFKKLSFFNNLNRKLFAELRLYLING